MSKLKPDVKIIYSGIFTQWDEASDSLPKLIKATVHVPAIIDTEFGFIVQIKKAKNQRLSYCIYHPDIPDEQDNIRPPFDGEVYVTSNDWKFYLGDTIWAPESNKLGKWRMTLALKGKVIAEKTFKVHSLEGLARIIDEPKSQQSHLRLKSDSLILETQRNVPSDILGIN